MDRDEARMRCIEAAARNPYPHKDGVVAGVLEAAARFEAFVFPSGGPSAPKSGTLGLPKKGM